MALDLTVKLGDLLTLAGFLVGGMGAFFVVRGDLRMLTRTVKLQGEELREMKEVVKIQATQNQRMDFLDRQLEDLRNGIGFKIHREFTSAASNLFESKPR
jgi:hypothetical protein